MNVHNVKSVLWFASATAMSAGLMISADAKDLRCFKDEPSRPHVSAACAPNWGYHPTCWQRFPPVEPCPTPDCQVSGMPGVWSSVPPDDQGLYVPQNQIYSGAPRAGVWQPDESFSVPSGHVGPSQFPVQSGRYAVPGSGLVSPTTPPPYGQMPGMIAPRPVPEASDVFEAPPVSVPPVPATPNVIPQIPSSELPPLPAPPEPMPSTPDQARYFPNGLIIPDGVNMGPSARVMSLRSPALLNAARPTVMPTSGRYGASSPVILPSSAGMSSPSDAAGAAGAAGSRYGVPASAASLTQPVRGSIRYASQSRPVR
jgi:hypothetical protein